MSLTEEVLQEISRIGGRRVNRSEFLEKAAWDRVALLKRQRRDARDGHILDGKARTLKSEAFDVLEYQAD